MEKLKVFFANLLPESAVRGIILAVKERADSMLKHLLYQ